MATVKAAKEERGPSYAAVSNYLQQLASGKQTYLIRAENSPRPDER